MARLCDRANQLGLPLRDPAEHKEGRTRIKSSQQVEQLRDLRFYPRLEAAPIGAGDPGLERGDLKVFFQVYREVMEGQSNSTVTFFVSEPLLPAASRTVTVIV